MNQRVTLPVAAAARGAWIFLSLLLPSALATDVVQSTASPFRDEGDAIALPCRAESRPYLRYVGAPALRFQEAIPPPDLPVHPPADASSKSSGKTGPDILLYSPAIGLPVETFSVPTQFTATPEETKHPNSSPEAPPPAPIVPDDVAPKARPEDFLPFFQFPGAGARRNEMNANVPPRPPVPPEPGELPPSTATYQQQ